MTHEVETDFTTKLAIAFVLGLFVGALGMWFWIGHDAWYGEVASSSGVSVGAEPLASASNSEAIGIEMSQALNEAEALKASTDFDEGLDRFVSRSAELSQATLEQEIEATVSAGAVSYMSLELSILLARLTAIAPERAMTLLDDLGFTGRIYRDQVLREWAKDDIDAALEYAMANNGWGNGIDFLMYLPGVEESSLYPSLRRRVDDPERHERLRAIYEMPPVQAFEAVGLLPEEQQRDAYFGLVHQWPPSRLAEAESLIARLADNSLKRNLMKSFIQSRYGSKPEAALDFALRVMPEDQEVMERALKALARSDSATAFERLRRYANSSGNSVPLLEHLNRLARTDVNRAVSLVTRLEPERRWRAYRAIAFWRVKASPDEAIDWALQLPATETETRDAYLQSLVRVDQSRAESLLGTTSDPEIRRTLVTEIASGKYRKDPEAAIAFCRDHGFPDIAGQIAERQARLDRMFEKARSW